MKENILIYLNKILKEIEDEVVFDEEEVHYWNEKILLVEDIINYVEELE